MSSTKIQLHGKLLRIPAKNHRILINSAVACGVSIKRHHRVSNVLSRTSGPSFGSVTSVSVTTDEGPFGDDGNGRFGRFGGKYVPETLMSRLRDLEDELDFVLSDHEFQVNFSHIFD